MSDTINLIGLDKAAVLAALYNASRPLGMGFLHYNPTAMTTEEAQAILDGGQTYFDYLNGRVMKVSLEDDELDPWLYDRDNGPGAAQRAIDAMVKGDDTTILTAHERGKAEAAEVARRMMGQPHKTETRGGVTIIEMGLQDVAEHLGPAVDKAMHE